MKIRTDSKKLNETEKHMIRTIEKYQNKKYQTLIISLVSVFEAILIVVDFITIQRQLPVSLRGVTGAINSCLLTNDKGE